MPGRTPAPFCGFEDDLAYRFPQDDCDAGDNGSDQDDSGEGDDEGEDDEDDSEVDDEAAAIRTADLKAENRESG